MVDSICVSGEEFAAMQASLASAKKPGRWKYAPLIDKYGQKSAVRFDEGTKSIVSWSPLDHRWLPVHAAPSAEEIASGAVKIQPNSLVGRNVLCMVVTRLVGVVCALSS